MKEAKNIKSGGSKHDSKIIISKSKIKYNNGCDEEEGSNGIYMKTGHQQRRKYK